MHAHIIEPTHMRREPAGLAVRGLMTPIGTFASGQSAFGSFGVIVEGKVGSFASGLTTDRPPRKR